ncbi:HHL293Cp [Eremothecium sinecaudum]|uniref:HHL293Cp n=1 Tax=Eremothecium sinecaudum TaxID=45286 RepID=A0A0X8HVV6_9SACH|nr:HHL293Cp [Eremothecium sinecaudum]AMD22477.1 HHL293Cp [Eremothecium sinecaudum]
MVVTTPVTEQGPGFTHTPPSRESAFGSPAAKFLKIVSGRSIKRIGSKFRRSSYSSGVIGSTGHVELNAVTQTPDSPQRVLRDDVIPEVMAAPRLSPFVLQNSKRRPKPLDLRTLSPPITVEKPAAPSSVEGKLGTPVRLTFPKSFDSARRDLASDLLIGGLDDITERQFFIPDYKRTPQRYEEEVSPTCRINHAQTDISSTPGSKRYNVNICSICGEYLNALLVGEKVVEMNCEHQSHYQCYSAVLEGTIQQGKYPRCETCLKQSKPKDEQVLHDMTSSLLLKKSLKTSVSNVKEHVMGLESAVLERPLYNLITPCEQLIKSADISSNGFKTPIAQSIQDRLGVDSAEEDFTATIPHTSVSIDTAGVTAEQDDVKVNIIPQVSKFIINENSEQTLLPFVLNCYVENNKSSEPELQKIDNEELRANIQQHVISKLGQNVAKAGALKMFDRMSYSFDGDQWSPIVFYWFERCFVLVQQGSCDDSEALIIGKIPVSQLATLFKYDSHTLILYLKSMSFPELYLRSPDESTAIISKWNFYLGEKTCEVTVTQQTSNCWNSLPKHILTDLPKELISYNQLTGEVGATQFWEGSTVVSQGFSANLSRNDAKLQLVVAVSLVNCAPRLHSNEELLSSIQKKLRTVLGSLNAGDLFGLVVSNDGVKEGKFYGMIGKEWDLWDEIIDSLCVSDANPCVDEQSELQHIMEVSDRLLSTVEEPAEHVRQLIILGNDHDVPIISMTPDPNSSASTAISACARKITSHYSFSILQYVTRNCYAFIREYMGHPTYNIKVNVVSQLLDVDVYQIVEKLHRKATTRLNIQLDSFDPNVAKFHSIEVAGRINSVEGPSVTLEIDPLEPGSSVNILFDMQVATKALLNKYPSCSSAPFSLVNARYRTSFTQSAQRHCTSLGILFKPQHESCTTPCSLAALISHNSISADANDSFMDIPLIAPLSPSRDSIFVSRQLQFLTIDALNTVLKDARSRLQSSTSSPNPFSLKELVSVLFGISNNCIESFPLYDKEFDDPVSMTEYTEMLCKKLDTIVNLYKIESNTTQSSASTPEWIHMARVLLNSLM